MLLEGVYKGIRLTLLYCPSLHPDIVIDFFYARNLFSAHIDPYSG